MEYNSDMEMQEAGAYGTMAEMILYFIHERTQSSSPRWLSRPAESTIQNSKHP